LGELAVWLAHHEVTTVGMEATGVFGGRCTTPWRA
jgi:hypothetical protein